MKSVVTIGSHCVKGSKLKQVKGLTVRQALKVLGIPYDHKATESLRHMLEYYDIPFKRVRHRGMAVSHRDASSHLPTYTVQGKEIKYSSLVKYRGHSPRYVARKLGYHVDNKTNPNYRVISELRILMKRHGLDKKPKSSQTNLNQDLFGKKPSKDPDLNLDKCKRIIKSIKNTCRERKVYKAECQDLIKENHSLKAKLAKYRDLDRLVRGIESI